METSPLIRYLTFELNFASQIISKIDKTVDIEVLHNFRVSIRKTRSLIKLFLYKEKKLEKTLKKIVNKTNKLRELDIFLESINKKKYKKLYENIKEDRNKSYDSLFDEKFISKCINNFYQINQKLLKLDFEYSIDDLIKNTHNQYSFIMEEFKNITPQHTSSRLHKIRIGFKKTRYALEFLHKTHISKEKKKIEKCKNAQDYFGNIQDLTNQLDCLKKFCKNSKSTKRLKFLKEKENELDKLKLGILL